MQTPITQPERSEAPPPAPAETRPVEAGASPLREAMLDAIDALSDEERERLSAAEAPEETVRIWRDLVADRAMRERQSELVGEAAGRDRAARKRASRRSSHQPAAAHA